VEYIYLPRHQDNNLLDELISKYTVYGKQQIIKMCRNAVRIGIVGSHSQAIHLIALNIVAKRVIGKSPVRIENNSLISIDKDFST
jgi:hypothetical protein